MRYNFKSSQDEALHFLHLRIKKLVEARKKLASAERSASYEGLINEATEAKAVLPREGVQEIYRYARINKINELFGLINRTESKALRVLAPRQKFRVVDGQKVAVLDDKGRPVKTHVPISFRQLDSLKRAINEQLNKALPGTTRHQQLEQFRNVVDDSRTLIKGDFNQRLHDLDVLYYEKIGIPFFSFNLSCMIFVCLPAFGVSKNLDGGSIIKHLS